MTAVGDGGDTPQTAQDLNSLKGKILRINPHNPPGTKEYSVPASNPYVGKTGKDAIWAYGFRNPWSFAFDSQTGALWAADVGSESMEEIDRVDGGKNYGWDRMEGTECMVADCSEFTRPRFAYPHGNGDCAIIGGFVYRGKSLPELRGKYLFSDYCSGTLWSIDAAGDEPREPEVLLETGASISSVSTGDDGEVYLTDLGRRVLQLVPAG